MNRRTQPQPRAGTTTAVETASELVRLRAEVGRLREETRTLGRLNQLQERFVAVASHEFKTPLTSITAYADVQLAGAGEDRERRAEFLGVVRDEAARLLRMVNRILDFSRLEYGSQLLERAPVDLVALARDTVLSFGASAAERGQTMTVNAGRWVPMAEVDADLVRQVLVNLVGNALKFTPDGGSVTIDVGEAAGAVSVEVADDGPGIPAKDLRRIFREFYRSGTTAAADGTGLGLSIVSHIINLHGGQVSVANGPRGGAVFTFQVPQSVVRSSVGAMPSTEGGRAIVDNLLRLLTECAGARAAVHVRADSRGRIAGAAWLGLVPAWADGLRTMIAEGDSAQAVVDAFPETVDPGRGDHWLYLDYGSGWILLGRHEAAGPFDQATRDQGPALARLGGRAIDGAEQAPASTLEAIRVLAQMHWQGVPSATPAAGALVTDLGQALDMDETTVQALQDAALLHDGGMARVEEELVLARGNLARDEQDEIDRHVELGLDLLAPLVPDTEVAEMIRHHHERWDGRGHPDGLAGTAIPRGARVLAVVDAWFAMTRNRPYRVGRSAASALQEIRRCSGTQFDPDVVDALAPLVSVDPAATPRTAGVS